LKVAIFLDYIGAIGGGERVALMLGRALKADIITTDINRDAVRGLGYDDVNIRSLGGTVKVPPLKQISASLLFRFCDLSDEYDFLYSQETGLTMRLEGIIPTYGIATRL